MDSSSRTREIFQQNCDLRDKLDYEQNNYRRKLEMYQQSQQRQAQLVKRLQEKVMQYKGRSTELEAKVRSFHDSSKRPQFCDGGETRKADPSSRQNTESLFLQLEEETARNSELRHMNSLLKEQLEQSAESSQQLTAKVEGMSNELNQEKASNRERENEFLCRERYMENHLSEEHGKMLMLWRDVCELRKGFENSRMESGREISRGKSEINKIMKNVNEYFAVQKIKTQNNEERLRKEVENLRGRVSQQASQLEDHEDRNAAFMELDARRCQDLAEKERLVTSLRSNIGRLEAEIEALQFKRSEDVRREREETEALHSSLRRIAASALGEDGSSDWKNDNMGNSYLSYKSGADATQSAVVAALDKKQQQVVDLRAKVTTSRERSQALESQLNAATNAERTLQREMANFRTENETLRKDLEMLSQDKEKTENRLEMKTVDYSQLEIVKKNLNERIDKLTHELELLQTTNTDLGRSRSLLQFERDDISREHERQLKENERCRTMIDRLEKAQSALKDEFLGTRELLNKTQLDKAVVENQKRDQQQAYENLEREHVERTNELRKTKYEKSNMAETIAEQNSAVEILEREKNNLNKIVNQLEGEKNKLQVERNEIEKNRWNLQDELVCMEQDKAELQDVVHACKEQIQYYDEEKDRLEAELADQARDRADLTDQFKMLNKQKSGLSEELSVARNEVSRQQESCGRLNKEKEQLVKTNSALSEQLRSTEKEYFQQKEYFAAVKIEKSGLESSVYDLQQQNATLGSRKEQLETENQELFARKETLNNELARVIKERENCEQSLRQEFEQYKQNSLESDQQLRQSLELSKQALEEESDFFAAEQERVRREFDTTCQELVANSSNELDEVVQKYSNQVNCLREEAAAAKLEQENALVNLQAEKHEIVGKLEEDNALLQQRLRNSTEDLDRATEELNRLKCDFSNLQGWSEQTVSDFENDVAKLKSDLAAAMDQTTRVNCSLTKTKDELAQLREKANQEATESTRKLDFFADENNGLRFEISELTEKAANLADDKKCLTTDVVTLKRNLAEETAEKEMQARANTELCDKVRSLEGEKSEMNLSLRDCGTKLGALQGQFEQAEIEIGQLRTSLRNSEGQKTEIDFERQQLSKELKRISYEMDQLAAEREDLSSKLAKFEDKDANNRRDISNYKQKVSELESGKDTLLKDLDTMNSKLRDLENMVREKDCECQMVMTDFTCMEKRLNDDKERLEGALDASNEENNELKMEISCKDGRMNVLETHVAKIEAKSSRQGHKLDVICTAIRRSIGVEPSNTETRTRSISPRRPCLARDRGCSMDSNNSVEVDENIFRTAVITVSERLARAEKDRDDFQAQLAFANADLVDLNGQCGSLGDRLERIQKYSAELEREKSALEVRLANVQTCMAVQEEGVKKLEKERKGHVEKLNSLEHANLQNEAEKRNLGERLSRLKATEARLENEATDLRQTMETVSNKLSYSESVRNKTEDDLKRCKGLIQAKSEEIECIQNKNSKQQKVLEDYEMKTSSLNSTIERLNTMISKLEEEFASTQDKNTKLSNLLIEKENKLDMAHERIAALHRDLAESDYNRNLLSQKITTTRTQLANLKRENKEYIDKADSSSFEVRECRYAIGEMESQIQHLTQTIAYNEQERQNNVYQLRSAEEARDKLENQTKTISESLENMEKDKKRLESCLFSVEREYETFKRKFTTSENDKSELENKLQSTLSSQNNYTRAFQNLEYENSDLQRQVGDLQQQLSEAEDVYSQRMFELSSKKHLECENEVQKLLNAQTDAAKMINLKDRVYRQKVRSLQDQVEELRQELSKAKRR